MKYAIMRMVTVAILLVDGVDILYAVIAGASTGNWASSVVSLVVLIPLIVVAGYLAKASGLIG